MKFSSKGPTLQFFQVWKGKRKDGYILHHITANHTYGKHGKNLISKYHLKTNFMK